MRYVTATIGALFIFAAVVLISFIVDAYLPPSMQQGIKIPLGIFMIWGTPALLVAVIIGGIAAVHSFRGTLKRKTSDRGSESTNSQN